MIRDDMKRRIQSGILYEGEYGLEIETETKEPYKLPKLHYWDVKPDGSLRDFGQEYVLKGPLNYGEQLTEALMEFHDKTKDIPFIPDSNSTSVHVHRNVLQDTWKTLGNALSLYTLTENLLMEVAGDSRRNNLFCLPIRSVPNINKLSLDIFKMVSRKQFGFSDMMDGNSVKYAALNLATIYRFGSVEIRSFRGVTDIDVIQSWVNIIHRIWEYSKQDVTPPEILDKFRDKGKRFLKEVFKDEWKELKHKDEDRMLMENLWFAGQFAYQFESSAWKKMDEPAPKPKIPEGIERIDLEKMAVRQYAAAYDDLGVEEQLYIIQLVKLDKKQVKRKSAFANPSVNPPQDITLNEIYAPMWTTTVTGTGG